MAFHLKQVVLEMRVDVERGKTDCCGIRRRKIGVVLAPAGSDRGIQTLVYICLFSPIKDTEILSNLAVLCDIRKP
jgi:hypothetical protein